MIFIDEGKLIKNEAYHGVVEEPVVIVLKKGYHKIKFRYFHCGGGKGLKMR